MARGFTKVFQRDKREREQPPRLRALRLDLKCAAQSFRCLIVSAQSKKRHAEVERGSGKIRVQLEGALERRYGLFRSALPVVDDAEIHQDFGPARRNLKRPFVPLLSRLIIAARLGLLSLRSNPRGFALRLRARN